MQENDKNPLDKVEITLSNGKKVIILKGKGRHAIKAQRLITTISGTDEDRRDAYLGILMSQLVTVDGKQVIPEELEDMDMSDYLQIQTEFSTLNFTLAQEK